jgi:hypothetical protein
LAPVNSGQGRRESSGPKARSDLIHHERKALFGRNALTTSGCVST